jgi:hypothetical protein
VIQVDLEGFWAGLHLFANTAKIDEHVREYLPRRIYSRIFLPLTYSSTWLLRRTFPGLKCTCICARAATGAVSNRNRNRKPIFFRLGFGVFENRKSRAYALSEMHVHAAWRADLQLFCLHKLPTCEPIMNNDLQDRVQENEAESDREDDVSSTKEV